MENNMTITRDVSPTRPSQSPLRRDTQASRSWYSDNTGSRLMNKRTIASAHDRIDNLEKQVVAIKTEVKIQFKDLFGRVKRMESIMLAATGAILTLLVAVLMKM